MLDGMTAARNARIDGPLECRTLAGMVTIEPGPVQVQEQGSRIHLRRGATSLCTVPSAEFNAWLRTHRVVYLSWS